MQHQPLASFPTSTSSSSAGPSTYTQQPSYTPYAPSQQVQRRRSTSPVKQGDSSSIDGPSRPVKMTRPTPSDAIINFRAEEEAARRQNAGRTYLGINRDIMGKHSDLFGRNFLRDRTVRLARDQGVNLDDDALAYLSQAAEQRLKALITSSIRAQNHRTQSSHHRPPPFTDEEEGDGKPMWSHIVTSDVSGVMDALARQNKEVELGFRASRMDRIAREAEMQRIREIREAREREVRGEVPEEDQGAGPSTPREKADTTDNISASPSSAPPPMPSTPVFGQVKEKPSGSTTKKPGKKTKDVSAETAHKMSNLTAMRATGGKLGKYSWLNNTPNVSSPLAGKKRKGTKTDSDAVAGAGAGMKGDKVNGDGEGSGSGDTGEAGPSKKSKLSQSTIPDPSTPQPKKIRTPRPAISVPSRRLVPVHTSNLAAEGADKRMVPDDQALTAVDVLFALEREGFGRGLGATEEVVWRVQGRAGGVWGKEGFGDGQSRR